MAADLIITADARGQLNEAFEWYEARQPGRDRVFLHNVEACIQRILLFPEMHAIAFEDYREAFIRRFSYMIVYTFADQTVTIYGVFHTSQDRGNWRLTLP
jgi:plasmid stabilization system protein ParE